MSWLLFVVKHWRIVIVGALAASLWTGSMWHRYRVAGLEAELAKSNAAAARHVAELEDCDAALNVQAEAIELWRERASLEAVRVLAQVDQLEELRRMHARDRGRLEVQVATMRAELEAVPQESRCEHAARWARERYDEVTR